MNVAFCQMRLGHGPSTVGEAVASRSRMARPRGASLWIRRSPSRAFTMLEVMVSIAIFAMVVAAIYAAWSAILRATKAGQVAAADAQRTRVTLRALQESLGATQLFMENGRHYSFVADTSGDFAQVSFVSHLPPNFPGSGMFGEQVLRRVTFAVEADRKGQNQLILFQNPVLEPADSTADPYHIVLAPNVREFKLFFFDTNTWEWAEEWLWTNRLPRMVRVSLAMGNDKNRRLDADEVAHKTIFISSVAIPREAQMPSVRGGGLTPPVRGGTNSSTPRPIRPPNPPAR